MNIVVYKSEEQQNECFLEFSGKRARHIHSILKLEKGDTIKLGELNKGLKQGRVVELSKERALVEILSSQDEVTPNSLNIELILAMPRPQTLKKVLELISCISITKLRLIDSKKVEKSYFSSKTLRSEEIEKHVILGLEQGRKVIAPEVQVDRDFWKKELIKFNDDTSEKIIFNQLGSSLFIAPKIVSRLISAKKTVLAIGPEGGWLDEEVSCFERNGFEVCTLGNTSFRVEHAVCAALSTIEQSVTFNKSIANG